MNRTDLLMNEYHSKVAIIVYQAKAQRDEYYIESHDFNDDGQLMAGKPLKEETISEIVDVFFDERKNRLNVTGLIPQNVLHFNHLPGGDYNMAWYREPEIRFIHFSSYLKIPSGKVWTPGLIYIVRNRKLEVYAFKSKTRPELNTALFHAPFHNVSGGSVCLGSAKVKRPTSPTYENLMKYWEDLFWLSEFSHLNGANPPTKTPLNDLYRKLIKSKTKLKWSDLNELIQSRQTLKTVLR